MVASSILSRRRRVSASRLLKIPLLLEVSLLLTSRFCKMQFDSCTGTLDILTDGLSHERLG